ncbi:TorF family putative porin [Novosphingobium sp. G106]|uniref:TorF family putative porin n=1 Tax=Novosphingobium sp. G106 TaxID=2849500 RepID=UPI001C2DBE49|nr:TorF family putative porin [Novosphingobium sp. G106]MBV1691325.1 TorF family putative porin [Novosphingobium sp. G106]
MSTRPIGLACLLFLNPSIAHAQAGATVTITTDERFRGRTVSRGDPAVVFNLTYDHPSGVYAGAAATTTIVESEPKVINVRANIGFIHRTAVGTGLELGVVQSNYSRYSSGGRGANYTEIYAGVLTRQLALHVHYSPHYFQPGVQTVYVAIDGAVEPARDWHLTAHAGSLIRVAGGTAGGASRVGYNWRIGAARSLGAVELQLAVSDGGPNPEHYNGTDHDRLAVTLSMVWSL